VLAGICIIAELVDVCGGESVVILALLRVTCYLVIIINVPVTAKPQTVVSCPQLLSNAFSCPCTFDHFTPHLDYLLRRTGELLNTPPITHHVLVATMWTPVRKTLQSTDYVCPGLENFSHVNRNLWVILLFIEKNVTERMVY